MIFFSKAYGKKRLFFLLTLGILILFMAVFFVSRLAEKPYSIVYLLNNEMYVGKLATFPRLLLTDAYLLQVVNDPQDEAKTNFQLAPLKDGIWSPKKLYLERSNVLFYGPIEESSKIAETLRNAKQ